VLAYRLRGRRPAARYDDWLRRDIDGFWYPLRAEAPAQALLVLLLLVVGLLADTLGVHVPTDVAFGAWSFALVLAVAAVVRRAQMRECERQDLLGDTPDVGRFRPYVHLDAHPRPGSAPASTPRWRGSWRGGGR